MSSPAKTRFCKALHCQLRLTGKAFMRSDGLDAHRWKSYQGSHLQRRDKLVVSAYPKRP